jgi:DNA-binding MarR family transcriptional regulator
MENQELVRRVPSPDDGRAYVLEPRPSAKKRAAIEATLDDGERRCFAALTAAERGELLRLLDKCIVDLDAEAT